MHLTRWQTQIIRGEIQSVNLINQINFKEFLGLLNLREKVRQTMLSYNNKWLLSLLDGISPTDTKLTHKLYTIHVTYLWNEFIVFNI